MRSDFVTGALALLLSAGAAPSMILTEIMYDPLADEGTDEFIELYNESTLPTTLAGWMISDGEALDELRDLGDGLTAAPGQYVLILDPDYLDDGSTTYDGLVPEDALVITIDNGTFGSRGLSNSTAERVSLMDAQGDTAASHTYTLGNEHGFSDEKILLTGGDGPENWGTTTRLHGTPGARNSLTPPERDLAVTELYAMPSHPAPGEDFVVSIVVQNLGLMTLSDSLFLDWNGGAGSEQWLRVDQWRVSALDYLADSVFTHQAQLEGDELTAEYRAQLRTSDDVPENNERTLLVGAAASGLLINEIMYSPAEGRGEWIELVNATGGSLVLADWSFSDGHGISDSTERVFLPPLEMEADSFIVIAEDSTIFFESMSLTASVVIVSNFPTLNNDGDSIVICDPGGVVVERVDYRPNWGNADAGVSLERVSVAAQSNDPLNWAASLDDAGSTPARTNSRAMPGGISGARELLSLTPNPFSPDGDGREDLLAVGYRLDHADSKLDVKIYDVRGREVKRLANNRAAGFVGELLWDGRDDQGRLLPTGLYVVYLEATGAGGSRVQSDRRPVALVRQR